MKKFNTIWYSGVIDRCDKVLQYKVIEAENIDEVKIKDILPKDVYDKVHYTRHLLIDSKTRTIDYGSWTEFISIYEINENN